MTDLPSQVDVVVIGGGPAGLASAISARMHGLSVLLLDSRLPSVDKPCGEGLMPDGVAALQRLGVDPNMEAAFPFRGIRFVDGECVAQAEFPNGVGIGMRRTELHTLLRRRAEQTGVITAWGCPVTALSGAFVHTGHQEIAGRWFVGADGIQSRVRRWAGLETFRRDTRRFGFRTHYRIAPWSEYVEIYWGSGFQIYVTPVAKDEVCVAVISKDPQLRLPEAVAGVPSLSKRLADVAESSAPGGSLTATRKLRAIHRGNTVLVGDASGSVDAITGEGMCQAFRQAADLGEALAKADLSAYAARRRRNFRRPLLMSDLLLLLTTRPRLRKRVIAALAAKPEIFRILLAAHVGAASPAPLAAKAVSLGFELLRTS